MRVDWGENKRQTVLGKRSIDFAHLKNLLLLPSLEDQRLDNSEQ
jgi:uncharacterized DUF497 family protein